MFSADNSVNNFESKSSKEFCVGDKKQKNKKEKPAPVLPQVSHEVMRTLSERHSKGLMSPHIYQILSQVIRVYQQSYFLYYILAFHSQ